MPDLITGEEIIQRSLQRAGLGVVLKNAEIDSIGASALTSVLHLRNGNLPPNYWRDRRSVIYRPGAASVADYVRWASTLTPSTGALKPDTDWADTSKDSENVYILPNELHPTRLVDALNRAMDLAYFENSEPLSLAADAGMQASNTTSWTVGATGTLSAISTADSENVFSGLGSKRFQNAATHDYFYQRFSVHPNELVYVAALAKIASGTAELRLWDVEGAAEIADGDDVTHEGKQWGYLYKQYSMPSTCKTLEVRLGGAEADADTYWNGLWAARVNDTRMRLSSTWDSAFKVPALAYARWPHAVSDENKVRSAFSLDLVEIPPSRYGFLFERPGPHPNALQLHERVFDGRGAVYIQGRRAYSDLTTFTLALSETTACPVDLIDALLRIELLSDDLVAAKLPNAASKLAKARDDLRQVEGTYDSEGPAAELEQVYWAFAGN